MIQDLTLPKSKVPLKATQLNSEAKRGRANSPHKNCYLEVSEALAFATTALVGICVAPRMVVLVGGGGADHKGQGRR